jgi:hypothetical protein
MAAEEVKKKKTASFSMTLDRPHHEKGFQDALLSFNFYLQ